MTRKPNILTRSPLNILMFALAAITLAIGFALVIFYGSSSVSTLPFEFWLGLAIYFISFLLFGWVGAQVRARSKRLEEPFSRMWLFSPFLVLLFSMLDVLSGRFRGGILVTFASTLALGITAFLISRVRKAE
jgi:high-affinity Fe2+/Pb2+ permease